MGGENSQLSSYLKSMIRSLPDHPIPGVTFRDITTLMDDPTGFARVIDGMAEPFLEQGITKVAAIEARGFMVGGALAYRLGTGFVPVRKKGKLPYKTVSMSYELEYGTDELEIHVDAAQAGDRILLVDDLIATGGTAVAAIQLFRSVGAEIIASSFIIDLVDLGGAEKVRAAGVDVYTLLQY
ncbi:adenine phosphoribosyltransferase [Microvirga sp. W0021]|uniref:Adenine phosphoribosyltransferase n=1 Tax=Hohaiivirga grylli TaxID=3133970 RepID=A0ABV0BJZ2_9HYPH